jgi:hypothetical protein
MNLQLIQSGIPVAGIYWALQQHPELWNQNTARTQDPTSPHHELDDIWVRYGDADQDPRQPHDAHWHEPADILSLKPICLDIMRGVLNPRTPRGARGPPHHDRGWHADAHDKYALQITSAPGQFFCFEGEQLESKPGDLYSFKNENTHWVTNDTPYERVTLIVCVRKER